MLSEAQLWNLLQPTVIDLQKMHLSAARSAIPPRPFASAQSSHATQRWVLWGTTWPEKRLVQCVPATQLQYPTKPRHRIPHKAFGHSKGSNALLGQNKQNQKISKKDLWIVPTFHLECCACCTCQNISSLPTSVWTKALLANPLAEYCARIAKLVTTESSENKSQALLWATQDPDDVEAFQHNFQDKVIKAPKHWAVNWLQSWIDQIHEKFNGVLPISWSKSCTNRLKFVKSFNVQGPQLSCFPLLVSRSLPHSPMF